MDILLQDFYTFLGTDSTGLVVLLLILIVILLFRR